MKTPSLVAFVSLRLCSAASVHAQAFKWMRQIGTTETDLSLDVSADGLGNVYISGYSDGSLEGPNAGGSDAFVSKYDASGTLQWTRQFGTSDREVSLERIGGWAGECLRFRLYRWELGGNQRRRQRCVCQQVRRQWHAPVDPAVRHQ